MKYETKSLKNAPKRLRKCLSPVQLPKSFHWPFFIPRHDQSLTAWSHAALQNLEQDVSHPLDIFHRLHLQFKHNFKNNFKFFSQRESAGVAMRVNKKTDLHFQRPAQRQFVTSETWLSLKIVSKVCYAPSHWFSLKLLHLRHLTLSISLNVYH